ncbi:hypothetical protein F511_30291 [Dorcoceras hygrometricum]|uniref:Uncharacterized protein n=1 Tax=Dorcoceras hygrometricum TaxID=472368 RepID=A0A2Z7BZF8_9LAMI|nr:hypothetical protein F511_30291 [Dorcoceras hygrometricum]
MKYHLKSFTSSKVAKIVDRRITENETKKGRFFHSCSFAAERRIPEKEPFIGFEPFSLISKERELDSSFL